MTKKLLEKPLLFRGKLLKLPNIISLRSYVSRHSLTHSIA